MKNNKHQTLLIIDFGSQVTKLIARRLREKKIYCEIHPYHKISSSFLKTISPKAIILSGGPKSVNEQHSPKVNSIIYKLGISNTWYLLWTTINDASARWKSTK